jgi:predicted O-methyltransferase YrrM
MSYITNPDIEDYCIKYTKDESNNLLDLKEESYAKAFGSQMISEKQVCKLLQFCANMLSAKVALDVGTFSGYSALALAEAMPDNAKIYTIDRKTQLSLAFAKKHFAKHPKSNNIILLEGHAENIIPTIEDNFDIVFIDANKLSCLEYYELVLPKVRKDGIIIVDDVLWRAQVTQPELDKRAKALDEFNKYIHMDNRVDNVLLPVRHGVQLIRKL